MTLAAAPRWILRVTGGPSHDKRGALTADATLRIGSGARCNLRVAGDEQLSRRHFDVQCARGRANIEVRTATATLLNGQPVSRAPLLDGDWIRAGQTDFVIREVGAAAAAKPEVVARHATSKAAAAAELHSRQGQLYALIDAARSERVLKLLHTSAAPWRSLYQGQQGVVLAETAPYLVSLVHDGPLLQQLLAEGWGDSWGIYLTSHAELAVLRRHLRRLLLVSLEAPPLRAYFRFYDPRVLRIFMRACTRQQRTALFGNMVGAIIAEDDNAGVLCWGRDD